MVRKVFLRTTTKMICTVLVITSEVWLTIQYTFSINYPKEKAPFIADLPIIWEHIRLRLEHLNTFWILISGVKLITFVDFVFERNLEFNIRIGSQIFLDEVLRLNEVLRLFWKCGAVQKLLKLFFNALIVPDYSKVFKVFLKVFAMLSTKG